jgi:hypothetical protein
VNDLAGGPKVNQLDLHPPVRRSPRQQWLHNFMLVICLVIFVGRVRRDVLFDHQAPQVEGRAAAQLPREHDGRDRLDRGARSSSSS